MKRIIIDNSGGFDSLLALALLAKDKDTHLIGVTTIFGKESVHDVTHKAKNMLQQLQIDIPIIKGAKNGLYRKYLLNDWGYGDKAETEKQDQTTIQTKTAHNYIIEQSFKYPKELEIIACGPLTNIALALIFEPKVVNNIKSITILGGSHENSDVTPAAEFNMYSDPEAAKLVFDSKIKLKVLPLDVTSTHAIVVSDIIKKLNNKDDNDLNKGLIKIFKNNATSTKLHLKDAVAVITTIDKDFATGQDYRIDIETKGSISLGKMVVDIADTTKKPPNATFVTNYNKEKLLEKIDELVNLCE